MDSVVEEKIKGPALALLVVGALAALSNLALLVVQLLQAVPSITQGISYGADAEFWMTFFTSTGAALLSSLVGFLFAFLVILGGMRLKQLRTPALVYIGAIVASLPCCGVGLPCCCIGLPVGVWVIMTMQDDQVKAAFTA